MNKKPFTEQEEKVMNLITEAHNEYCKLEIIHSSAANDWINAVHQLQKVLMHRVVSRDYPNVFK